MQALDLFPETKPPRAKPRVLMHVSDAGGTGPPDDNWCRMQCVRCNAETDWINFETVTEAKRGIPCPACNSPAA
jgi:hypothetical protein